MELAGGGDEVPGEYKAIPDTARFPGTCLRGGLCFQVLCRNPVRGTARDQAGAASVPDSEGGGDGVGRPFSYQGDVTAPGGSADPREDDGTRPMAEGGGDLYSDGPR